MRDEMTLEQFLESLWAEETHSAPQEEEWPALIARIKGGRNEQVDRGIYAYFLGVLLPHYFGGDFFAFCEGREPLKLFARRDGTCVARQLTWEQTLTFCRLAGIDLPD